MKEDWDICDLELLTDFALGGDWGKDENFDDDDYDRAFCIRGSEFKNWDTDFAKTAVLRKLKKGSIEKRSLKLGDILVEISGGGPEQPVGRTEIITPPVLSNFKGKPVVCTNFLRMIRINKFVYPYFINWYLKYFYSTGKIREYQAGSNNLRNLKFDQFLTIALPLAPLPIQRAIVSKIESLFSALDKGIEDLNLAKAQLKVYRQAVLKKAFEGELIYNANKEPLKNISSKIGSGSTPKGGQANYKDFGIPLVRSLNIHFDYIKYDGLAFIDDEQAEKLKNVIVKEGDVLLNITGASIGRVNIAPKDFSNGRVNQHVSIIRPKNGVFIPKFLKLYLQSSDIQNWIMNANYGVTRQALTKDQLENLEIPLPTIEEQSNIIKEIESRLSVCDQVERSISESLEKAKALRQSILKKAFEGKLLTEEEIEKCRMEKDYEPAEVLLERIRKEKKK
jgi:type I restriction enzyme S subunit